MKTILRFNFYRSLLAIAAVLGCGSAFGQASLPINRTDWGSEPAGWTNSGCSHRTSSSACSNSSSTTFDTNGDSRVVFFNAAPLNLKMTLKNQSMSGSSELVVEQSANGTSYTVLGRYGTKAGATAITNAICTDFTVSLSAATRYVRWTYTKASGNIDMDDVVITAGVVNTPSIVVSPASISGFGDINVGASSGAKFVQVSGTSLTQNVVVASNDGSFEISLDQAAWESSLSLAPVSGTLSNKTVFIRFSPASVGLKSSTVSFASAGAVTRTVSVSGTGIANTPVIAPSTLSLPSFGDVLVGTHSAPASFTFDGVFLAEEVSVVASSGFEISLDNAVWFTGSDVSPVAGTVEDAQVWVRFSPAAAGPAVGSITLSSAGAVSRVISLSGNAVVPAGIVMDAAGFGPFCNSESAVFEVSFAAAGTFAGTGFSAQLSDGNGVFSDAATNIVGTAATSPISVAVPSGTAPGNYRIRIFNEDPLVFSNNNGSDIVINAQSVGGTVSGSAAFCGTANSGTLVLAGNVGTVVKWQSSASQDFSGAVADIPNTTSALDFSNLSETTYFRAVVASHTCSPANSSAAAVTINPVIVPDFAQIPAFCSGSVAPVLASASPNGITGTWNPAVVSNTANGTYIFTPDGGQCASSITLTTEITALAVPDFAQIPAFCSESAAPVLASASPNGITGTWNPAIISNTANGTYIFTPDAGQCASSITLTTEITALTVPDFAQIPAFCSGSVAPVLASASPNGITGTWNPAIVSNTQNGTYIFTPDAGQCASAVTLATAVNTTLRPAGTGVQDFTAGQSLANFTVSGQNIKWYDAPIAGSELQSSQLIVAGMTYYASQTVNGCESSERLAVTAGIDLGADSFVMSQLKYYPNPTDQVLNFENGEAVSTVAVFNFLGQQVLRAVPNASQFKLDVSGLPSGTYMARIASGNNTKTVKIIKK